MKLIILFMQCAFFDTLNNAFHLVSTIFFQILTLIQPAMEMTICFSKPHNICKSEQTTLGLASYGLIANINNFVCSETFSFLNFFLKF